MRDNAGEGVGARDWHRDLAEKVASSRRACRDRQRVRQYVRDDDGD